MSDRVVRVRAPSRLHFGLLSFGLAGRQFGGAGLMIDTPSVVLEFRVCGQFAASGPSAERVHEFANRWSAHHGILLPNCHVAVLEIPPQHCGLGVGTQLGLAVAAGLSAWNNFPGQTATELAVSVQRGLRSAVGTYGFASGGFIVNRGKANEPVAPLDCRLETPPNWRFLVARPPGEDTKIFGQQEAQAFRQLPTVPRSTTDALTRILQAEIVPGVATCDCELFSHGLFRYGELAGLCFESVQGGAYNGERVTQVVHTFRELGVSGVGQSSWGPTVFAVVDGPELAARTVEQFREHFSADDVRIDIASPNNHGAEIDDSGAGRPSP